MRRCFQCGKRTDAEQLTSVGDGEFCAACFQRLLEAEGEGARAAAPAARRETAAPVVRSGPSAPSTCLVCERRIDGAAAVSFLGGEICATCNAQMQRELRDGQTHPAVPPARAEPRGESAASRAELAATRAAVTEPAPASFDVADAARRERETGQAKFTPGAETRWCAGCERPMPGPGSYRVIGGEPYCPACVPFYSVLNLGAHPRHPASRPDGAAPTAGSSCDCCGASLELGDSPCEGFHLCTACYTSDVELALGVARARHRRKLEALRAAIDTGKKS